MDPNVTVAAGIGYSKTGINGFVHTVIDVDKHTPTGSSSMAQNVIAGDVTGSLDKVASDVRTVIGSGSPALCRAMSLMGRSVTAVEKSGSLASQSENAPTVIDLGNS